MEAINFLFILLLLSIFLFYIWIKLQIGVNTYKVFEKKYVNHLLTSLLNYNFNCSNKNYIVSEALAYYLCNLTDEVSYEMLNETIYNFLSSYNLKGYSFIFYSSKIKEIKVYNNVSEVNLTYSSIASLQLQSPCGPLTMYLGIFKSS